PQAPASAAARERDTALVAAKGSLMPAAEERETRRAGVGCVFRMRRQGIRLACGRDQPRETDRGGGQLGGASGGSRRGRGRRRDELHVAVPAVEQSRAAPAKPSSVSVKQDDPKQLVLDAIAEHRPDLVVLALREGEDATWLEKGELGAVPAQIEGVPLAR